jgi:outer membrane protein TolC
LGFGPALVWNVFDHGVLTNQVLVQDARFQQLYEQYQDVVLRAARELDDAASGFAYTRSQVGILRDTVKAARRSLDIATIQYREGLVDFQRVLDSQRTLFSAQESLVASQGGVVQYLIAVYKAMGGGWHAGRSRPVLDDATQATMSERSNWKSLLQAPLPSPSEEFLPPPTSDTP